MIDSTRDVHLQLQAGDDTRAAKLYQTLSADNTVEALEAKLALLEQKLALKYSRAYAFARA